MKSIVEFIMESVKSKNISGSHYVKAICKELDFDEDIKCNDWKTIDFENKDKDKIRAYWSNKTSWIFYYYLKNEKDSKDNFAAVAHGTIQPDQYSDDMFKKWDDMLMNGATIPYFDKFDTDLI